MIYLNLKTIFDFISVQVFKSKMLSINYVMV